MNGVAFMLILCNVSNFQIADFNAMILSAQFWPSLKEEKLEVPESIKQAMEKYTKSYEVRMPYSFLGGECLYSEVNMMHILRSSK